jgi:hypothetical protein
MLSLRYSRLLRSRLNRVPLALEADTGYNNLPFFKNSPPPIGPYCWYYLLLVLVDYISTVNPFALLHIVLVS